MAFNTMDIQQSSSYSKHNVKIGKVLQKFLEPNFKVKNDVYLNLFLTRLVSKNDEGKISRLQANDQLRIQFCQWIVQATNLWEKSKISPPATVLSFALNLTSQLSEDEHTFVNLNCQNVFESLVGVANSTKHPSVTLGIVTLLCSFLEHKSGVQWVMATPHWNDMVNLGLNAHTLYIRKKAYQFITKLLEKTFCINRSFTVNLVGLLIRPFQDVIRNLSIKNDSLQTQIQNKDLFMSLKPTMSLLSEVLCMLLKVFNGGVLHLFLEQETSRVVEQLLLLSQSEDFSFELLKIQFTFLFYKLCKKLEGVKVVAHDSLVLYDIRTIFELIKNEMVKNNVRCVIKISGYAHSLYCSLALRMPLCVRNGEVIEFQNQMLLFQLMPVLVFSVQILCGKRHIDTLLINDDFRKDFIYRLLKIAAIKSIEICYKWKETLQVKPDLMEDVTFSLQYLMRTKKLWNKEQAATMFPALVYALRDTLNIMEVLSRIDWTPRCIQFVGTLLETIVDVVETFDLTWKDSVEAIRVMDLACEILQYPEWTEKIIVIKGLKLLKTAISKYMSPDMVLLVYSTKSSTVSVTGSILFAKCHDSSWEIRDSALEVVYILSRNANNLFPALTDVLLDAKLPQLVVRMALKDSESYVRATSFKCLQELIQIDEIWNELETINMLLPNIINVFENETEGLVRQEAACLIFKIHRYRAFPDEMLPRLYDVMTHACVGDLHWEVKFNALDFWFQTWKIYLTNQGMIDRMFPSHTFSKELKKIVTLTDAEVKKRIIKVLNQLSQIGCLYVMKSTILDDCDSTVSKKSIYFCKKLIRMFRKYKIPYENIDLSEPPSPTVLPEDRRYNHLLFEPVSPASSTTMTAPDPSDIGNLGSPCPNIPYFDPLSPFPPPLTSCIDLDIMTPPDSNKPQTPNSLHMRHNTQTQYGFPAQHQELSLQTPPVLNRQLDQDPLLYNPISNQTTLNPAHEIYDIDMCGPGDQSFKTPQLEHVPSSLNHAEREKILDDFLNSSDVTLLEGIYKPSDKVKNSNSQMKSRTYLAPSEYLKFIYNEVEPLVDKLQRSSNMDEFDSLLDDILKEYNLGADVNSLDCY